MKPETASTGMVLDIVRAFLSTRLSMVLLILALGLGIAAIELTPREEEPQIVVPMADIFVSAPGATAGEVERLVATPLERLLWQIDGVEYVYSMSRDNEAVVTVRFFVGEDREDALVKLHNRIRMHRDAVPPIVTDWWIKPVEIDDVPIVLLTLHGKNETGHSLRRMGEELAARLSSLPDLSRVSITGGSPREIGVTLLVDRLSGYGISIGKVEAAIRSADVSVTAGRVDRANRSYRIAADAFFQTTKDLEKLVVGVHDGRPVFLSDVAEVKDGPAEVTTTARFGMSAREAEARNLPGFSSRPSVTVALSKKKGTNAVTVAEDVITEATRLSGRMFPSHVKLEVMRNTGKIAQDKVSGLLSSLGFAILSVVILLAVTLGWREALVVAIAVPVSFSLALFVNLVFGYTINRVTLFALILSLGLVVDDPITNVDNIQRNMKLGLFDPATATLVGVRQVLTPVVMSTIAIMVCFVPLFFITGMMGPYMAPMAVNVPLTVLFSTICALSIVPWLAHLLLRNRYAGNQADVEKTVSPFVRQLYGRIVSPFLSTRGARWGLLFCVITLFTGAIGLAAFGKVPLKLLPFDNKSEFQIVLDMPEGTPLAATDAVVRRFEAHLEAIPEVTTFTSFVGTASPMDFNGMVRHYYLRKGDNLADIRVNLVEKNRRKLKSHALVLRLRSDLEALARASGATMQIVEVPPGPPVLSTLVAEIYGGEDTPVATLRKGAEQVAALMAKEPFVTDIDVMGEASFSEIAFAIDREKAARHGVAVGRVLSALKTAVGGVVPATLHVASERQVLPIRLRLSRAERSELVTLFRIPVESRFGNSVPLGELVTVRQEGTRVSRFHKNLEPVVYVTAEMAGRAPAEAVLGLMGRLEKASLPDGIRVVWTGEGEWKITLRVFRDMGIAFAFAMVGIYLLLAIQAKSFSMPLLIMMAIPLTLLGILPGFWGLNLLLADPVGGYANPVFFTATSMIGMIALGGIVIRNSLVLIEFIEKAIEDGMPEREAVLESGAIRLRPIVLTALTTAIGAWPITLDPVFSGLAWALIFGLVASTLFTLLVIPVAWYALYGNVG